MKTAAFTLPIKGISMNRAILLMATAVVTAPLLAAPAVANRSAADACAAKLPADAKLIYGAAIGSVAPGIDLREMVRSKTRALVIGGKLSRGQARPAAEAAGVCLKQAL
jgi:hypothetical protein